MERGRKLVHIEPRMRFPLDPGSQDSCLELCATEGLPGALLRHYSPTWPEVKRAKAMWLLRVHAPRNLDQSHHSWAGVSTQGGKTMCICHRKGETSLVAQMVKCLPTMWETWVWSLGREDPLEKEMATHSSTLAWKIPWTEQCGRLQFMGSQRVGHDWATSLSFFSFTPDTSNVHSKLSGHPEVAWLLARGAQYYFLPVWTLSLGPGQCSRTHDFTSHSVSCLLASPD